MLRIVYRIYLGKASACSGDEQPNIVTSVNGETGAVNTIDDTSTSSLTKTWSASKLNTTIGDIETLLQGI